jgi:hypothetical protein
VLDIIDLYHPVVPSGVGRLDMPERQVILGVKSENFIKSEQTIGQLKGPPEDAKTSGCRAGVGLRRPPCSMRTWRTAEDRSL